MAVTPCGVVVIIIIIIAVGGWAIVGPGERGWLHIH